MTTPLWKCPSGKFAGSLAFDLRGSYLAEIVQGDYIGKRQGVAHGLRGVRAAHVSLAHARHADRIGLALAGYVDPY